MANHSNQADGLFQLSALPVSLWPMERVVREFKADEQTRARSAPAPTADNAFMFYYL